MKFSALVLKAISFCTALTIAQPSLAAWSQMAKDEHGTMYVDMTTVRKTTLGVAVWTLYDAEVPYSQRDEYVHSTRVETEFNCDASQARTLRTVKYAERMAGGKVIQAELLFNAWEPVNPRTGRATLIKMVCTSR
jgi:hypothetical protein